ncbi:YmdB family metallophosphoesterase [Patescibacteria group bacterium]|nr:YmdB family metallophosphoesterase [Patescibacteria group bacterium]
MKILFLGDIVASLGRQTVNHVLPKLKEEEGIDLVFANAENLAGGRGVTQDTLYEMLDAGVDYFTSGNHVFHVEGWKEVLEDQSCRLLRPANYPEDIPGRGYAIVRDAEDRKVLLISLMGRAFFGPATARTVRCPFAVIDKILSLHENDDLEAIVIDLHTEATSEKQALGFYVDGRVSLLVGTHTHVPTADARLLPRGTAYVTDVGMIGSSDSVLGVKKEIIWKLMRYPYPQRFEWVKRPPAVFQSVLAETEGNRKSESIKRHDVILKTL